MKVFIKNMVCQRCILVVKNILDNLPITDYSVALGYILLNKPLKTAELIQLKESLVATGLDLLDDTKSRHLADIKKFCLEFMNKQVFMEDILLSKFLSDRLTRDYSYLSRLFSSVESISIEQYYIAIRIEKVKELISYEQQSFSEIAYGLGFSSVSHLSQQFKKNTGLTLTEFKSTHTNHVRTAIDNVKII